MKISIRKISLFTAISLAPLIFLIPAKGGRALDAPEQAPSVPTFGGNPQHTSIYQPAAQNLNRILWSVDIDLHDSFGGAHYSPPLITAANNVVVPVKTATDGFVIRVFNSNGGNPLYTLTTDYVLPTHGWIPVYNPVLTTGSFGTRLYYPGRGGTIYHIDNPDSSAAPVVQEVFYTTLANYQANAAAYNAAIFVNTPITADSSGNIFFGFRVQGTAPAPISSTQSGFARIDPNGNGSYVLTGATINNNTYNRDNHNSAPALSNDETTLYVVVKQSGTGAAYLVGLNSTTLATKYQVHLRDPRDGGEAVVTDDSTSSPTVGPDGDVYFGLFGNPGDGSRGFLLHFSGDLATEKPPGGFGWDYTCAIVPASMVPSYQGSSSYLIFAKYNNYAFDDGDGVNRIALLDPNATQLDPHPSAFGLVEMREVLTVNGPTPDPGALSTQYPYAVREWCINTAAVNPATNSIFTPSEDGYIYRWNVATNSLSQAIKLTQGIGEPYVPTVIGPGGVIYTLNGGTMFALGGLSGVGVVVTSSIPDLRSVVVGQSLTFTATVTNEGPTGLIPSGTVTFTDLTYQGTTAVNTTLGTVSLNAGGQASLTTSSLTAGGNFLGNHLITATYSGDANFSTGSARLHQKVHANATTTTLISTPNPSNPGQAVTFTATVAPVPAGSTKPSGMVTFQEGNIVLAQVPLNIQGSCSFNTSSLVGGSHTVTATYHSDTAFASSNGSTTHTVTGPTPTPTATPAPTATPTGTPGPTVTPSGTPGPTATPSATPGSASQAVNLSTRMRVLTGDNVGIGGFIVAGTGTKHVLIRAIGPSLSQFGVSNPLADPVLELHGPGAFVPINNDNWQDDPTQRALIEATGLQPTNNFEPAIDARLNAGNYTAIVSGKNNTTGVGLIEVYDLDATAPSKLANISTRAFVSTGNDIVIAGFILGNQTGPGRIIVRGIGPSLTGSGVANPLADPTLELRDNNGTLLLSNNNWGDDPTQANEIMNAGLAPSNSLESALAVNPPPGLYTALLAGFNNGTGVGLIEVFDRGP